MLIDLQRNHQETSSFHSEASDINIQHFTQNTLQDEKGKNISFDIRVKANIRNEVESLLTYAIKAIRIAKAKSSLGVILGRLNQDNANQDILRVKLGFTVLGAQSKKTQKIMIKEGIRTGTDVL